MSIKNIYQAESWSKVYTAFSQINFTSYDYETIKLSIIDYIRIYFPENFNDFIESSELITLLEGFAYVAEQLAYRMDMLSHENFLSTAQRKQSILKLAKLISYSPSRNIPARGLVKITSISTSERVIDSQGINLSGLNIIWNDPNNTNWKEQFFLVLNRCITGSFGQFASLQQIGDVSMQLYTFNNSVNTIPNGIFSFTVNTGIETFPMELVPVLLDENGPYEKTPDVNSQLSVIYSNDGLGDGSDYTGFLMYAKQGVLSRLDYTMSDAIPNRALSLAPINVNETDVWVTKVDNAGLVEEVWEEVETLADQNLSFNIIKNRKKFEVETLENDAIKLIFGDGDFSDIPVGKFFFWLRQSANRSIVIPANKLVNQPLSFQYTSTSGMSETCSLTYSLTSTIQNSSASESIEHIRQSAPSTYYAQNRMVNAQDYNTYMLKDQSILRLTSVNRTFAGQPKYIEWNDASGQYQNIKLFGDDLDMNLQLGINSLNTGSSISSRGLIDEVIEPLLSSTGIINTLAHISATDPLSSGMVSLTRRQFIEDNRQLYWNSTGNRSALQEKTLIQGAIDQHWYGEPLGFTTINNLSYALIQDPGLHPEDDGKIWLNTVARTIDGVNPYIPGDVGSGLQSTAWQTQFGLAYVRHTPIIGTDITFTGQCLSRSFSDAVTYSAEVFTIEVAANGSLLHVSSNIRGYIGTGEIGLFFSSPSIEFTLEQTSNPDYAFMPGDAIKVSFDEVIASSITFPVSFQLGDTNVQTLNLLGRWELINGVDLTTNNTVNPNTLPYDPNPYLSGGVRNPNSWLIWVKATLNPVTQQPTSFTVNFRELKLAVTSKNTKFWYNSNIQIIDSQTKNRVYDTIRVLRSNLRPDGRPLGHNENYDVVGPIVDANGQVDLHSLEVIPSDMLNTDTSGNTLPDSILQFSEFVNAASNDSPYYTYFQLDSSGQRVLGTDIPAPINGIPFNPNTYFEPGSFVSNAKIGGVYYGRTLQRPGLDFMWQHFTPYENLVDPSVSNIHDTYVLTQGYYNSITNYVQGRSNFLPTPPTPLELRNQFADLLDNKMLSDTVVLHPGKIKLLFGALAEPQFRAKFKLVKSSNATLSDEKLRIEVLSVINSYFGIENWDFGETFYATELFALIHQRLPTEIASVVLVPVYAVNSFGSLFTVSSGLDEILQSCARLSDIEIVAELNASVLRQGGLS